MTFVPEGNQSVIFSEKQQTPPVRRPLQPYADARYFYDPDFYPEATVAPFKDPKDEFWVDL